MDYRAQSRFQIGNHTLNVIFPQNELMNMRGQDQHLTAKWSLTRAFCDWEGAA